MRAASYDIANFLRNENEQPLALVIAQEHRKFGQITEGELDEALFGASIQSTLGLPFQKVIKGFERYGVMPFDDLVEKLLFEAQYGQW